MQGGQDWWRRIQQATDKAEYLVLVLTPGALASKVCKDEWRYARQVGTYVIPVTDLPIADLNLLIRRLNGVTALSGSARRGRCRNETVDRCRMRRWRCCASARWRCTRRATPSWRSPRALGVHKNTVCRWLKGWRVAGAAALKAKKRGRRHEAKRLLDADQASRGATADDRHIARTSSTCRSRSGAARRCALVRARFGVRLALRTVSDYLRRWGFTPQRPIKRALERQDAAIQAWLAEHYPKIAARAKAEGAVIHWGDETGISNQPVYGRSFAPKGQTPVLRRPATRRTLSMISAVTNRGTLALHALRGCLERDLVPHLPAAAGAQCCGARCS